MTFVVHTWDESESKEALSVFGLAKKKSFSRRIIMRLIKKPLLSLGCSTPHCIREVFDSTELRHHRIKFDVKGASFILRQKFFSLLFT